MELDDYAWLRDDSRTSPKVLEYLERENKAATEVLEALRPLQDAFHDDMAARVPDVECTPAQRKGQYWYYSTRHGGDQYWSLQRVPVADCLPTRIASSPPPGATCVLDCNQAAANSTYWDMGSWDVSPSARLLALTVDLQGSECYHLEVRYLQQQGQGGEVPSNPLVAKVTCREGYTPEVFWGADDSTVYCVERDSSMEACTLVRLHITAPQPGAGSCLGGGCSPVTAMVERQVAFRRDEESVGGSFSVERTRDYSHLVVRIKGQDGDEVLALPLGDGGEGSQGECSAPPNGSTASPMVDTEGTCFWETASTDDGSEPQEQRGGSGVTEGEAAAPSPERQPDVGVRQGSGGAGLQRACHLDVEDGDLLWVDHWREAWLGVVDSDEQPDGCVCQLLRGGVRELVTFREEEEVEVEQAQLFGEGLLVLLLRHRCQFRLETHRLGGRQVGGCMELSAVRLWQRELSVEAGSASLLPGAGPAASGVWVQVSGLTLPVTVLQYDLRTQAETVVQVEEVAGGFDPKDYTTELQWAPAPDGTLVPIHLAHHTTCFRRDGRCPVLLQAYGAYGHKLDPAFNPAELALLDRGWGVALAHVRGGGELGSAWHLGARRLQKRNTFSDLLACVDHLVAGGCCSLASLVAWGRSAGGLALGAALNLRPGLMAGAVLDVPFLDPLTAMMDPSLPLTIKERREWGDPLADEEVRAYIRGYSPYTNIQRAAYPHLLLTAGLHDPRVSYWQVAKYAACMRDRRTDPSRMLLLLTADQQGHFAASRAGDRLQQRAMKCAFLAKALGLEASGGYSAEAMELTSSSRGLQEH